MQPTSLAVTASARGSPLRVDRHTPRHPSRSRVIRGPLDSGLNGESDLPYSIDESNRERQELLSGVLDFGTKVLVEQVGLASGSRCLDVGCGMGGAARVLCDAAGSNGECVGVDLDPELLGIARSKGEGDGNISFVQGDAAALPFEDDTFDLVHARYLFIHLPNHREVIGEMVRVAKPGGTVALYEPDLRAVWCYPESWAYEALPAVFAKAYAEPFAGRKLVSLLRGAGCSSVKAQARTGVEYEGSSVKRLYRLTFEGTGLTLLRSGEMTQDEFNRMDAELRRVEEEESAFIIASPSILAWGVA